MKPSRVTWPGASRRWIVTFMTLLVAGLACNDDKPKKQAETAQTAEPIPSDLVYNAGLEDPGAKNKILFATDAGGGAASPGTGSTAKLVEAGADPKTPLVYAFGTKARTVSATIKIAQTGGPQGGGDEQTIKLTFTATPKPKFGLAGAATIDVKITKVELALPANAPPQAAKAVETAQKALIGVSGHFDATTHGDIDNLDFESENVPQNAAQILQLVQEALQFLVVPLPNEPVGIGGKWTKNESKKLADQGATASSSITITLQARDAQTATLKVDATLSGSQSVQAQGAPKGLSVQRSSTGSYTVMIRFDGVSQKVDGELKTEVIQKVPGQPDQTALSAKVTQNLTSQ
jgi:hypothetical protein